MKKKQNFPLWSLLMLSILFVSVNLFSATTVGGELKMWHNVTVTFDGPSVSEVASTFTNYRLDVTFTGPSGQMYKVPGFFAADGNAGVTSATSGNKWRVNFCPDETGNWSFSTSFVTGTMIAADLAGGTPTSFDGATGSFVVAASDKDPNGLDFRGKGKLVYAEGHYLQFKGNGKHFIKAGWNSPETFLETSDFDGTTATLDYSTHLVDWKTGDPTWNGGKGKGIIGWVNYNSNIGSNVQYFLSMNIAGDGKKAYPFPNTTDYTTYDCSKLDQWDIVFSHMDAKGMMIHFVLSETENEVYFESKEGIALTGFANSRKIYYRELVARFGYHMAITWNIGEENGWNQNTATGVAMKDQQRKDAAARLSALAYYNDNIVVHNGPSNDFHIYPPLVNTELTGTSLQISQGQSVHSKVLDHYNMSDNSNQKWVISYDEPYRSSGWATADSWRKNEVWANFMAGGAGIELYKAGGDKTFDDAHGTPTTLIKQSGYAAKFLMSEVGFSDMKPSDNLVGTGDYCLANTGIEYLVYLPSGGTKTLNLSAAGTGSFSVKWFDPRNGGSLQNGSVTTVNGGSSVSLGAAPNNTTLDWVVLVKKSGVNIPVTEVSISGCPSAAMDINAIAQLSATVTPSNATNKSVNWTSSNSTIATVDASGLVTAKADGSATITVTTVDQGKTATCVVTVLGTPIPVTGVTISGCPSAAMTINATSQLTANVLPTNATNKSVSWLSSDTDVATVSNTGLVTAKGAGSTIITGTTVDGSFQATCNIAVVNSVVDKITILSPTNGQSIPFGQDVLVTVDAYDGDGIEVVRFRVDGLLYFNVSTPPYTYSFTGLGAGTHTIDVQMKDVLLNRINSAPVTFTVEDLVSDIPVTGVSVSGCPTTAMIINETKQLTATVAPTNATNKSVNWSSSNTAVATVSSAGLVTAIAAGSATITVTTVDGNKTSVCNVTVATSAPAQTPYGGVNRKIPGLIEAEHYDEGVEGSAFHDNATKQGVLTYRADDMVDVVNKTAASNGMAVGYTLNGEWLEYKVDVTSGTYDISLSYLCNSSLAGDLEVSLNDAPLATITNIAAQTSLSVLAKTTVNRVNITAGGNNKTLRLKVIGGAKFDIDAIEFIPSTLTAKVSSNKMAESESVDNGIRIYPNPVSDILNLEFTDATSSKQIKVFNAIGQLVYSAQTTKGSTTIDVKTLNMKGVVMVQVVTGSSIYNNKVIIK